MTTESIAQAFLVTPSTIAQRIVRAKAKIRNAGIPYQVPAHAELAERLESVSRVVYLVFNEGYLASSGDTLTRPDLSVEAIRVQSSTFRHLEKKLFDLSNPGSANRLSDEPHLTDPVPSTTFRE